MTKHNDNIMEALSVTRSLAGEGFVVDEPALLAHESKATPTSVTFLQIAGGFLGSLAFLALMFVLNIYDYPYLVLGLGTLFTAISLLNSRLLKNSLPDTISIFLYIIGCFLSMMGGVQLKLDTNLIISIVSGIAVISIITTKNKLIAFTAAVFFIASLIAFTSENRWENGIHAIVNLCLATSFLLMAKESQLLHARNHFSETGSAIGSATAIAGLMIFHFISLSHFMKMEERFIWTSSLTALAVCLLVIHKLSKSKWTTIVAALILAAPSILAPAIVGGLAITLIGFGYSKKTLWVLGVLSFIQFTIQFYYDLKFTLLDKSIMMMVTGALFLTAYFIYKSHESKQENGSVQ
jgi:hypothetical protein